MKKNLQLLPPAEEPAKARLIPPARSFRDFVLAHFDAFQL
jgi:hypothetical protein